MRWRVDSETFCVLMRMIIIVCLLILELNADDALCFEYCRNFTSGVLPRSIGKRQRLKEPREKETCFVAVDVERLSERED